MMGTAIDRAVSGIHKIDFDSIAAEIAKHEADIAECDAAISTASARQQAIEVEMDGHRRLEPTSIADALIAGNANAATRPALDDLHDERQSLNAAVVELRRRIETSRQAIDIARKRSKGAAGPLFEPVVAEMTIEATALADRLAQIYANCHAIGSVANINAAATLRIKLSAMFEKGGLRLLSNPSRASMGPELQPVADALSEYADQGALPMLREVTVPS